MTTPIVEAIVRWFEHRGAPEGHRRFCIVAYSHEELRRQGESWETVGDVRRRVPPRLRCECGRSFVGHQRLGEHHAWPGGER